MALTTIDKNITTTVLTKSWPEYKREAPLPPELMNLTIGYLVDKRKIYWDNGKLRCQGTYVNGEKHGEWEWLYINGQLWIQGNYINGKQYGEWKCWYENGQIMSQGTYVNGKKNNDWKWWYYDGQKQKSLV